MTLESSVNYFTNTSIIKVFDGLFVDGYANYVKIEWTYHPTLLSAQRGDVT